MIELLTVGGVPTGPVTGNISKIQAAENTVMVLTKTNNLYVIGTNYFSGIDSEVTSWTKVAENVQDFVAGYRQVLVNLKDGRYLFCGLNNHLPVAGSSVKVPEYTDVTQYFSGPMTGKTLKSMSIGQYALALVNTDGTVVMSGLNQSGSLGTGSTTANLTPVLRSDLTGVIKMDFDPATSATTFYLKSDGKVYGAGASTNGQLGNTNSSNTNFIAINTLTGILDFTLGWSSVFMIRNPNASAYTIHSQGANVNGSLGVGTTTTGNYPTPQQITSTDGGPADIYTGPYHARYYFGDNGYYTGTSGGFTGVSTTFNAANKTSFTLQNPPTKRFVYYCANRATFSQSYGLFNGILYGAGSYAATRNLLPGYTATQQVFVPLDTTPCV